MWKGGEGVSKLKLSPAKLRTLPADRGVCSYGAHQCVSCVSVEFYCDPTVCVYVFGHKYTHPRMGLVGDANSRLQPQLHLIRISTALNYCRPAAVARCCCCCCCCCCCRHRRQATRYLKGAYSSTCQPQTTPQNALSGPVGHWLPGILPLLPLPCSPFVTWPHGRCRTMHGIWRSSGGGTQLRDGR
jgi:hypothetical protein